MRSLIAKIILTGLVLLIIIISPVDLESREIIAKITKTNDFINCSKLGDKSVVLIVDIGNVLKSDSLYACNFEIEYQPEVIRYGGMLSSSTIINEKSEFSAVGDSATRAIRGFIYDDKGLYGNKPLFAIRVELADTCFKDSILFKLRYIEFTDEYQNVITKYEDVVVAVNQSDKLKLATSIEKDTLFFENKIITMPVNISEINYRNISDLILSVEGIDTNKFNFIGIESSNQFQFVSKEYDDNNNLILNLYKNNILLNEEVKLIFESISDTINIQKYLKVKSFLSDKCKCDVEYIYDSVVFKQNKYVDTTDTTGSIDYQIKKYYFKDKVLSIEDDNLIEAIWIYDLNGSVIDILNVDDYKFHHEFLYEISSGIYFLVIKTELTKIRKKIFINN